MSVTFLPLEKQNINAFDSSYKYLILDKPHKPMPPTGKTRITPEDKKNYEEQFEKYNQSLQALESGYVNLYNNRISTDNSDQFASYYLVNGIPKDTKIFYIDPLQSVEDRSYHQIRPLVSEFEVKKEIKTADELLDVILDNYDHLILLCRIFEKGIYHNFAGKERVVTVLRRIRERTNDPILVNDLIKPHGDDCTPSYKAETSRSCELNGVHEYVNWLIEQGVVAIFENDCFCNWTRYLERLVRLNWTDFALDLAKEVVVNDSDQEWFTANNYLMDLLLEKSEDQNVREILKLLGVKTVTTTLIVKEYDEDAYEKDYDVYEQKNFADMGELRSYLITEYKVPFDKASGDINDLKWDDYVFSITTKEA